MIDRDTIAEALGRRLREIGMPLPTVLDEQQCAFLNDMIEKFEKRYVLVVRNDSAKDDATSSWTIFAVDPKKK